MLNRSGKVTFILIAYGQLSWREDWALFRSLSRFRSKNSIDVFCQSQLIFFAERVELNGETDVGGFVNDLGPEMQKMLRRQFDLEPD